MIKENVENLLSQIPPGVELIAASKKKDYRQIQKAIQAGIKIVGENYVNEAEQKISRLGQSAQWHLIGHLQRNKVKKAVKIFDMIQTLDSQRLAEALNTESKKANKVMPVLLEVNSAKEKGKTGILPEGLDSLIQNIIDYENIKILGLMTMGPFYDNPQKLRPYFSLTRKLFKEIKEKYTGRLDFKYLSMGMSDSYRVAIEEGANMVRIGTGIFGKRTDS